MKLRQIVTIWLAIYPISLVLNYTFVPFLKGLPLPVITLVMTMVVVPIMVLWGIPVSHHIVFITTSWFKTRIKI